MTLRTLIDLVAESVLIVESVVRSVVDLPDRGRTRTAATCSPRPHSQPRRHGASRLRGKKASEERKPQREEK